MAHSEVVPGASPNGPLRIYGCKSERPGLHSSQIAHNSFGLFDGLLTLCYIEMPRGKFSVAILFARFANLILKSLNRPQEAT